MVDTSAKYASSTTVLYLLLFLYLVVDFGAIYDKIVCLLTSLPLRTLFFSYFYFLSFFLAY